MASTAPSGPRTAAPRHIQDEAEVIIEKESVEVEKEVVKEIVIEKAVEGMTEEDILATHKQLDMDRAEIAAQFDEERAATEKKSRLLQEIATRQQTMKKRKAEKARKEKKQQDDDARGYQAESKSSSVPKAPSRMQALEHLLCLAGANGSYHPAVQSILGVKDKWMHALASECGIRRTDILLTALVLTYLRSEFPADVGTWVLVSSKSMAWLGKNEHDWKTEAITDVEALISSVARKWSIWTQGNQV
eukprot:gnl/MRDRNA2_/MRDRNA2_130692_c0_seq1.p1 gnl/MRDRNA2_/MRDRNA2_130692_c0~~gnl/MRDRNA2_/MRDRNA2_130692_c0_seq1.p1  ORF type:complete len:247 (-),score=59.68 gnl/MRDRNA2_/MRDRNA2_130692_c0_seq1:97-837(-)